MSLDLVSAYLWNESLLIKHDFKVWYNFTGRSISRVTAKTTCKVFLEYIQKMSAVNYKMEFIYVNFVIFYEYV